MLIRDKVAVVTGAAHRVGKAIAVGLAQRGAHVVVHYHQNRQLAEATAAEIRGLGRRAAAVGADLGTAAGVEALFAAAREDFGPIDILVNSAAIMEAADPLTLG